MGNGNCVEVRVFEGKVHMRDSGNPAVYLAFEKAQFAEFLVALANQEFGLS
jgi:ABC-type uncharacterized transport system auxiliary subunit